jgi:ATP-dependent RNA helicase DDX42
MSDIVKEMNMGKKIPDTQNKEIMYNEDPTDTYYKAIKNQIKNDLRNVGQSKIDFDRNSDDDFLLFNQDNDKMKEFVDSEGDIDIDRWKELKKKSVEPLPIIDHSQREYEEIKKNFYFEDEEIARMSPAEINRTRKERDIKIRGYKVTNPIIDFSQLKVDEPILKKFEKLGFLKPTPIQCQAIPAGLEGRDIIGIAKTGSGKTLAYTVPMIMHILDQRQLEKNEGPIGIVISPMRELCQQIYIEVKKFAKLFNLNVITLIGGENKTDQWKDIKSGAEILIATPGRLIDLVRKGAFELNSRCSFLVLDEVDKMFDLGFEYQIRSIINQIRPDRQILMFSATLKKKIENLVKDILVDPIKIFVGKQGASNEDVTQFCFVLDSENEKWKFLAENLEFYLGQGQVLIFANQIGTVEQLFKNLETVYNGKGNIK